MPRFEPGYVTSKSHFFDKSTPGVHQLVNFPFKSLKYNNFFHFVVFNSFEKYSLIFFERMLTAI
jgi:hypothetical protein